MEKENLQLLSLYMDSSIIVLAEEKHKLSPEVQSQNDSLNHQADVVETENSSTLNYVGEFGKKIMIVFEGDELSVECHDFMFKLISAINCSIKDVAIFSSVDFEKTNAHQIIELDAQKIIVFGKVLHEIFNFRKSDYEIINIDQIDYLFADNLNFIIDNVISKKLLWSKLKSLFNLN